ncbi:pyridoxamine 5'-phosphate oxidase family protein [Actinomadura sp. 6K520]|uniref:pyridoxamine 5'-phosphate oxidase family protein n=1 Tax=Actinomadura sp. 6K520 TaxID=2530364 RepID=UPI001048F413|nr:pyridoxamine 5'-phosphate oxidase family protein [Actinomadura sp. 6K520]TDE34317.1 pyridoxamine 5'-phosphate oxidase family protein [Actinomadura sp. 6K520]
MHLDQSGLEILDRDECLALLSRAAIGRIVFTHQALPAVQPVNFVFDGTNIVIKVSRTSRLATAAAGTIVAFEVDEFDIAARTGWSVVAVGPARHVTDPDELRTLDRLPLRTWAPVERDRYICLRPELLTGRRVPTRDLPRGAASASA